MKLSPLGLFIFLAGTTPYFAAEAAKPDTPASASAAKPKEKENPLRLPPARRASAGFVLSKPTSATLTPEINGYGRVLDPIPLVSLLAELETAQAAATASESELTRTKKLFDLGTNASAQSVETATAAATRDRVALSSARTRLIATWGRALADHATLPLIAEAIGSGQALVRVDLTAGDTPAPGVKTLRLGLPGSDELFEADVLGVAPGVDAQSLGQALLATVKHSPLPIGAALRAIVPAPGSPETALTVLRGAVVYHQGSAWIFVLGEEDTFERKFITLGRTVGDRVVIHGGVEDSELVLTTGAQQLLSAELAVGGAPEEP
jgi:hypothetical protein